MVTFLLYSRKLFVQSWLEDYREPSPTPGPQEIQTKPTQGAHVWGRITTGELVTSDMVVNTARELDLNRCTPSREMAEKSGCWEAVGWRVESQKGGGNWGGT